MADGKLTERQERFVNAYVATGNGAEAARQAGFTGPQPRTTGGRELAKPNIREAIKARMDALGLTEAKFLKTLSDGLEANAVKTATDGGKITDERTYTDHVTRHKYLETGLKLRDMFPAERHEVTEKGEFDGWSKEELIHYANTGERPDHD